ncbi:hypothetical protein JHK87_047770 [Glycine soja]|nr:hypothetical protein JHK87_047770 [Glycine soja]
MISPNVVSWTAMISGSCENENYMDALQFFIQMQEENEKRYTALLSGCKNSGLVMDGWKYFDNIKIDYNINPTIEHYSCMVDLLGKAGFLDEALDFIRAMPQKVDTSIWGVVLAACKLHKDIKIAEIAARNLLRPNPLLRSQNSNKHYFKRGNGIHCSSSKGCSARKQLERSKNDSNMLVITYTSEHNHPWPTQRNALPSSTTSQPSKHNNNVASNSKNSEG